MNERYLIDPPGGHTHGFPKQFFGNISTLDLNAWLALNGYPQNEIDLFQNRECVPARILGPFEANDPVWRTYP